MTTLKKFKYGQSDYDMWTTCWENFYSKEKKPRTWPTSLRQVIEEGFVAHTAAIAHFADIIVVILRISSDFI